MNHSALQRFSLFVLPPLLQGGVGFLLLPVTTYILGPADYGAYALVTSVTALGGPLANLGSGYLLAAHYLELEPAEQRRLISTLLALGLGLLALFVSGLALLWPHLATWLDLTAIPLSAIALALLTMVLSFPWLIAIEVITLERQADRYALVVISQTLVGAIALILSLYVWRLGLLSLFVSGTVGAAVSCLGSLWVLQPRLGWQLSHRWIRESWCLGIVTTPTNLLENFYNTVERSSLSAVVGLDALGLYTHSQQYRSLVAMPVKAIGRTVWSTTLNEAKQTELKFAQTRIAWDMAFLLITAVGLIFAIFGPELIGLLTYGKFAAAAPLTALWMVYLLTQNTGRPQVGLLFAHRGVVYSKLHLGSVVLSILLVPLLAHWLGSLGAFLALYLQQVLLRLGIQWYVNRHYQTAFQDQLALLGIGLILSLLAWVQGLAPQLWMKAIALLLSFLLLGLIGQPTLRHLWQKVAGGMRQVTRSKP